VIEIDLHWNRHHDLLEKLIKVGEKIMATQAELVTVAQQQLTAVQTIGTKIDALIATNSGGQAAPELVAAMQATTDGIAAVDAKLNPPPAPTP
jgi:hypothetical protein